MRSHRFVPPAASQAIKVRLYVDQDLRTDADVGASERQAHYLARVMRLAAGNFVKLFNGRDGEWQGQIEAMVSARCRLRCMEQLRAQTREPGPTLAFAPIKKDALDFLVEKATELGARGLVPVMTRFTAVERFHAERVRAHVIEAAEQCGRLTVPQVLDFQELGTFTAAWPVDRPLLLMDERGRGRPIIETALAWREGNATGDAPAPGLLIGPEGGFSDDEVEALSTLPSLVRVSLGPRVLRSETAAIAALACWQALAGDWRPIEPPSQET